MGPTAKQAVRDFNNKAGKFAKQLTTSTEALRRTVQSKPAIGRETSSRTGLRESPELALSVINGLPVQRPSHVRPFGTCYRGQPQKRMPRSTS